MKSLLPQRFGEPAAARTSSPEPAPTTRPSSRADATGASLGLPLTSKPGVPSGDDGFTLDPNASAPEATSFADAELQGFMELFQRVNAFVRAALPANDVGVPAVRSWEIIIRRAVGGQQKERQGSFRT